MKKTPLLGRLKEFLDSTGWTEIEDWEEKHTKGIDGMCFTLTTLEMHDKYMYFELDVAAGILQAEEYTGYAGDFTVHIKGEFHENPAQDVLKVVWEYMPNVLLGKDIEDSFNAICNDDELPYESEDIVEFIKLNPNGKVNLRDTCLYREHDKNVFGGSWNDCRQKIDARFTGLVNFIQEAQMQLKKVRKIILLKLEKTVGAINTQKE